MKVSPPVPLREPPLENASMKPIKNMGEPYEITFEIKPTRTCFPHSGLPDRKSVLKRISEAFPDWPGTYYEQALQLKDSGRESDLRQAISLFDQAIELDKNSLFPEFWIERGHSYLLLESFLEKKSGGETERDKAEALRQAEQSYRKAVALAPDDFDAQTSLGLFYFTIQKTESAQECFEKALELCRGEDVPDEMKTIAHANLAGCLLARTPPDREQALRHFDRALEFDKKNYKRWADKGVLLYRMERFQEASEYIREALALDPPPEMAMLLKKFL